MSKKSRKNRQTMDQDFEGDFEFDYEDDFDLDILSRDIHSTDWGDYNDKKDWRADARRKIERRKDMKKLYSNLDEWEEMDFG